MSLTINEGFSKRLDAYRKLIRHGIDCPRPNANSTEFVATIVYFCDREMRAAKALAEMRPAQHAFFVKNRAKGDQPSYFR